MKKKELYTLIQELQQKVALLEAQMYGKQDREITLPSVWPWSQPAISPIDLCTDGQHHEYPFPWHSTAPAPCKKCGKQAQTYTITCSTPPIAEFTISRCPTCVDNKCQCKL